MNPKPPPPAYTNMASANDAGASSNQFEMASRAETGQMTQTVPRPQTGPQAQTTSRAHTAPRHAQTTPRSTAPVWMFILLAMTASVLAWIIGASSGFLNKGEKLAYAIVVGQAVASTNIVVGRGIVLAIYRKLSGLQDLSKVEESIIVSSVESLWTLILLLIVLHTS